MCGMRLGGEGVGVGVLGEGGGQGWSVGAGDAREEGMALRGGVRPDDLDREKRNGPGVARTTEQTQYRTFRRCPPAPLLVPVTMERHGCKILEVQDQTEAHLQYQDLRIPVRQLTHHRVHLHTWFRPRSPEVDERDAIQIFGK